VPRTLSSAAWFFIPEEPGGGCGLGEEELLPPDTVKLCPELERADPSSDGSLPNTTA